MKGKTATLPPRAAQSRSFLKRWGWIAMGVLVLSVSGAAALYHWFPQWNLDRLVVRAQAELEAKYYGSSSSTARRILQLKPENV